MMSGWSTAERVLLLAAIVFAGLTVYRLIGQEAMPESAAPSSEVAEVAPPSADGTAGPPASPAGAELLARIRSCSEQDLAAIVDNISGAEALGIFRELTVTDREAVFSALPVPVLARRAQELLGIPERCFRHNDTPGLLASSLVDAALGGPAALVEAQRLDLRFSTTVDERGVPQDPRNRFAPDDRKIYACVEGDPERSADPPGVLVRWTEQRTGALVHLHYLPFSLNRRSNYVYFDAADGWAPGVYRVSFYRIGAVAALFAEGTYSIGQGS